MNKEEQIEKEQGLKPLNSVIQRCKRCGKLDAYKGDNHDCDPEFQAERQNRYED